MNKTKKIVLSAILLLVLIGCALAANSKQILSIISGIEASNSPVITSAFTDKEKYFPADTMTITAETKNASEVKAFVENESGYNEATLVVAASFNGKKTWSGKWKVENALSGKKYDIKIVAYNKSGTAETILEWEDPNPGHPWNQIDNFPAACGGNDFVKGVGAALTCATPASGSPTTWACVDKWHLDAGGVTHPWDGAQTWKSASCDIATEGIVVGGNCIYDPFNPCPAPYFGSNIGGLNGYTCGCRTNNIPLDAWARCCK